MRICGSYIGTRDFALQIVLKLRCRLASVALHACERPALLACSELCFLHVLVHLDRQPQQSELQHEKGFTVIITLTMMMLHDGSDEWGLCRAWCMCMCLLCC